MIPVMIPLSFSFKSKLHDHKLINKLKRFPFFSRVRNRTMRVLAGVAMKNALETVAKPRKRGLLVSTQEMKESRG